MAAVPARAGRALTEVRADLRVARVPALEVETDRRPVPVLVDATASGALDLDLLGRTRQLDTFLPQRIILHVARESQWAILDLKDRRRVVARWRGALQRPAG